MKAAIIDNTDIAIIRLVKRVQKVWRLFQRALAS